MTLQDEIKELVLSFFQKIGSKIIENDGVYEIHIPKKYQDSFQAEQILFSFDEKIASERNVSADNSWQQHFITCYYQL